MVFIVFFLFLTHFKPEKWINTPRAIVIDRYRSKLDRNNHAAYTEEKRSAPRVQFANCRRQM